MLCYDHGICDVQDKKDEEFDKFKDFRIRYIEQLNVLMRDAMTSPHWCAGTSEQASVNTLIIAQVQYTNELCLACYELIAICRRRAAAYKHVLCITGFMQRSVTLCAYCYERELLLTHMPITFISIALVAACVQAHTELLIAKREFIWYGRGLPVPVIICKGDKLASFVMHMPYQVSLKAVQ
jgi:hypothetical protein